MGRNSLGIVAHSSLCHRDLQEIEEDLEVEDDHEIEVDHEVEVDHGAEIDHEVEVNLTEVGVHATDILFAGNWKGLRSLRSWSVVKW